MAIDMSKVLKAQQTIENRSKKDFGPRAKFWKATKPKNKIRVMPDWAEDGEFKGQFWREVVQHWVADPNNGDKLTPVMCEEKTPYMSGESCKVCEYVEELRAQKSNVEAQELAKSLRGKTAYLLTIIDQADPEYTAADLAEYKAARPEGDAPFEVGDPKFQIYAAPMTVFNLLLSIIQNNSLDITNAEDGHDIVLEKSGSGLTTKYAVSPILKASECKYLTAPAFTTAKRYTLPNLAEVGQSREVADIIAMLPDSPSAPKLTSGVTAAPAVRPVLSASTVGKPVNSTSLDDLSAALMGALEK